VGQKTYSEVFAESLTKLADGNDKVVAITAAMPNGTALDLFRPHHPTRYFDVGIAEEHAVLFAAGMATKGYRPFCAIYSTFLQRAFDQIVHGPTHHGLFDISYLRGVPNLIHMDPMDEDELQDMMFTALGYEGPSAIRYPRGVGPGTVVKAVPVALEIGKAEVLRDGRDVAVFALGAMVAEAEKLAKLLEADGHSVAVINARFAKPVDAECVARYGSRCELVITMEDHVLAGGFGSAVLECLNALEMEVPVVRVGWPDEFIEHGKVDDLRAKYGLTAEAAVVRARAYLTRVVAV
jgi:1-deoxy-D-xylulose-5-phosphate synthase